MAKAIKWQSGPHHLYCWQEQIHEHLRGKPSNSPSFQFAANLTVLLQKNRSCNPKLIRLHRLFTINNPFFLQPLPIFSNSSVKQIFQPIILLLIFLLFLFITIRFIPYTSPPFSPHPLPFSH
ncbi:hypothetical protein M5K25_003889 [Dendrobium thyrsiflorum]|uniref:Uncharacterized protein n=1 Tax=Dendrobium thyrsiflorum TaxID=117978 RepID=A0ABD0VSX3_DENTH